MSIAQTNQISKVAEELYEANRQFYIQDLSHHIDKRITSGMAQIKNGQYMDKATFNKKVMSIKLT